MTERNYTINELKTLISESANEIRKGIQTNNKQENQKYYKETSKKIKNFDGGGEEDKHEHKVYDKLDGNKTTLDYSTEGPVGKNFIDKVKAQAEGYTSTLEKNNKIEKNAEFNDKTYKQFKKAGKEMAKNIKGIKKRGLTASKAPEETFEKNGLYENQIPYIHFKNKTFINEAQMISSIPDKYKVEGNKFKVKDAGCNEFIVEWKDEEANILFHENKKKLNETISSFQKLINYKSKDFFKTSNPQSRLNESTEVNKILNNIRIINNKDS
jgi:hypothetical protein